MLNKGGFENILEEYFEDKSYVRKIYRIIIIIIIIITIIIINRRRLNSRLAEKLLTAYE